MEDSKPLEARESESTEQQATRLGPLTRANSNNINPYIIPPYAHLKSGNRNEFLLRDANHFSTDVLQTRESTGPNDSRQSRTRLECFPANTQANRQAVANNNLYPPPPLRWNYDYAPYDNHSFLVPSATTVNNFQPQLSPPLSFDPVPSPHPFLHNRHNIHPRACPLPSQLPSPYSSSSPQPNHGGRGTSAGRGRPHGQGRGNSHAIPHVRHIQNNTSPGRGLPNGWWPCSLFVHNS
jgi:hypothetical protein